MKYKIKKFEVKWNIEEEQKETFEDFLKEKEQERKYKRFIAERENILSGDYTDIYN
jgi:hypothetical protein